MNKYVPGMGPLAARIAIVGESPSNEEVLVGKPFVGPSGRFLTQLLNDAKISRDDCWITNACKYFVPPQGGDDKKIPFQVRAERAEIDLQQEYLNLRQELIEVKPNVIIALGGTALWALTGKKPIKSHRGSILLGSPGIKVVPTYHPAHILHQDGEVKGYWNKHVMVFDLKRALKQSYFPEINRPVRHLRICKNSYEFSQFIERNKENYLLAVDIEARNCIPVCIGLAFSASEGLTIPLWNVEGISTIPTSDLCVMWAMLDELLRKKGIIGQNFGYDRDKIKGLGFLIEHLHDDTMLKAFSINPELPKNLAFNTSIYTEEPYYKDEGMYEGSIQDLFIGCARDACVTYEVNENMNADMKELGTEAFYRNFILPLHGLYLGIENEGFKVDEDERHNLLKKYIEWDEQIRYELFKLTGDYVNTSSPKQVAILLYEVFKLPLRKGTGEEVLTALLNNNVKQPLHKRVIELILEDRRVKNTINNYLLSPADYDGRMRTTYFLCLETGRSSTGQQEPPIRPIVEGVVYDENGKKKKQKKARGMAFQTITKHGDIGADVRQMLVADEGEIFLQADSEQAEARVIFLLAEDYEALHDIDTRDYHAFTTSWFFGGKEEDYSKRVLGYESPQRFIGKTLRHAGHLGASKHRAMLTVNTDARKFKIPVSISEPEADRALKIFHQRQPKIKQIFQAQVREHVKKYRRLAAPVPYGIDAPIGGVRIFYERDGEDLYRQAFSYIPQRAVSENTKGAALRIKGNEECGIKGTAPWIRILVESHDALLVSVPVSRKFEAAEILRTELERPIDFSTCSLERGKLIIPCAIEEGFNYKDLTKFKWLVPEIA